jgi:hypothetical protein
MDSIVCLYFFTVNHDSINLPAIKVKDDGNTDSTAIVALSQTHAPSC